MSRVAKVDYSGRTVDLLLLQYVMEPTAEIAVIPDVSKEPRIVTGIEKLVQRYSNLFLTEIGSVRNSDGEGTEFMRQMYSGQIYDDNTLRAAAASANDNVFRQLREEDVGTDIPDDELIARSTILSTSIDRGKSQITVTVQIETESGATYTYVTPVAIGV